MQDKKLNQQQQPPKIYTPTTFHDTSTWFWEMSEKGKKNHKKTKKRDLNSLVILDLKISKGN